MATFTEKAKLTAYAIVKIFETGKPFGDYSAVAVLDDGAGISYGISQFTHKSGSLELVLRRFRVLGGELPEAVATVWSVIDTPNAHNIRGLSGNARVKAELKELGKHPLMQRAQREIAFEKYMKPAIEACDGSGFRFPLSLAVIYDSKNHGSYDLIRDRTIVETPGNGSMPADDFEREWIAEYCRQRLAWLKTRRGMLRNTVYRPQTFLDLIKAGNWDLDLPLSVRLGTGRIRVNPAILKDLAAVPADDPAHESESATSENPQYPPIPPAEITPPPDTSTNIQVNETTASVAPPASFVPEEKTLEAPAKDGATATTVKTTIFGVAIPAGVLAFFKMMQEWVEKGYIDMKEVLGAVLDLIRNNVKYVSILAGLIVGVVIVKKIFKQATFLLQLYIQARPDLHNVTVVPAEVEPKRWWEIWK